MNTRETASEYRMSHWAQIMRERQESGQSIKGYCEQSGICVNTYHYWQRKLRETACEAMVTRGSDKAAQMTAPKGWAICAADNAALSKAAEVSIEIGKCCVSVTEETDPELLTKVCQMLMALC